MISYLSLFMEGLIISITSTMFLDLILRKNKFLMKQKDLYSLPLMAITFASLRTDRQDLEKLSPFKVVTICLDSHPDRLQKCLESYLK